MPGGLPPVLITNTETISEEIDNTERVQVEDVARLWRVYTLNSTHMEDDEGTRLENFFWRIWSNPSIIRHIRGNTLARLFITISEGGDRVRTTPVPTPLGTTPTQSLVCSLSKVSSDSLLRGQPFPSAAAPQLNCTHVSPETSEQPVASPGPIDTGAFPQRPSDQARILPPILKKSRTGSDDPPKSAKISSPDTEHRDTSTTAVRRESSESAGPLSPTSVPTEKSLKNAGKKTSFAAASGNRKARPGVMRKRSSQPSGSAEQRKGSQTSPSAGAQPGRTTPKSATGLSSKHTTATFALPSSSWQDVDSPSSSRNSLDHTFSTSQQPSSWLVDKNFRGKFVENLQRATSSVNLAALGKSQSVRFLDEMPEYKKHAGQGQARTDEVTSEEAGQVGRPERSPPAAASSAIEEEEDEEDDDDDDDDDGMPALPRTKSQLSMLIDKERKYSGSTNLGPEPPRQENRPGKDDKERDDQGEENELLVMAHRDKTGKAKDPDQPFKAAAKKGLWRGGSEDDGGGGTRSPPPVF